MFFPPNKLPRLPPKRDNDFEIQLIPKATPISKSSYWIAVNELRELKVQLEEVLEKGFTQSNASPWEWETSVLFM